jgi:hypothetical protein
MPTNRTLDRAAWEPLLERMEREMADRLARTEAPPFPQPRPAPALPAASADETDSAPSPVDRRTVGAEAALDAAIERLRAWLEAARAVR